MIPPMNATPTEPEGVEALVPLSELIEELSRPEALGTEGPVEVVQTHVSAVFLTPDRAYKIKKPLRLWGFIDYGTVARRKHWCEVEVALNRRVAPDIYLGVEAVVRRADGRLAVGGEGEVVEHAVVMRRLPRGATLQEHLDAGTLTEAMVREAAETLADFHAEYRLAPEDAGLALPSAFGGVVRQNFLATRGAIGELWPAVVHEGLARRIAARMLATRRLIRERVAAGRMVNGHGDVRLEHVVRLGDTTGIFDCVEFSDWIRHVDPLCDMAFLSMDLTEQGRPDLARVLEQRYVQRLRERPEDAAMLLPLYLSYRAHVRAKVDDMTYRSPEVDAGVRAAKALGARRFLALAWTYARDGETPPLILMRGLSGSGKSRLARRIAPWLGADVISSDLVRKELAGLEPTDRLDAEGNEALYSSAMSARTYATMLERGLDAIRAGHAAILDATFLSVASRRDALRAARAIGAPFAVLDVTCDDAEIRRRLAARAAAGQDASDADIRVYEAQRETAEPLTPAEEAMTARHVSGEAPEPTVMTLLERLERA